MLRRFCAVLLMLACALAPVVPAPASTATETADCCCGAKCACDTNRECASAPTAPVRAPQVVTAGLEQRVVATKPTVRVAFAAFARRLPLSGKISASSVRPASANRGAAAASVALFQAHCSLRI
jgi:hypothetical protein